MNEHLIVFKLYHRLEADSYLPNAVYNALFTVINAGWGKDKSWGAKKEIPQVDLLQIFYASLLNMRAMTTEQLSVAMRNYVEQFSIINLPTSVTVLNKYRADRASAMQTQDANS